jgi:hypothetical protein
MALDQIMSRPTQALKMNIQKKKKPSLTNK